MRDHITRHSLIRIQLDVKKLSVGLERAEQQARQGPGEPIELELLQSLGACVLHSDRASRGIDAPEANVLMAIVSGNTGNMPCSVEVIPVVQEVHWPGKHHSKNMLRIAALVEEQVRHQGAGLAAAAFEIRVDVVSFHRSEEHTSELQSLRHLV